MTESPHAELTARPKAESDADPELTALPKPRRPWRHLTIAAMGATVLAASFMLYMLRGEALYALSGGDPLALGDLRGVRPEPQHANRWVRGSAALSTTGAVAYQRPLESDTFRLSPVADNPQIWVQVRVPDGFEERYFVPPNAFVGRLIPVNDAGLRYRGLGHTVHMPPNAWLLIDGEAPSTTRWVLGLWLLFAGFAAFNTYGLVRLLRPVRDG